VIGGAVAIAAAGALVWTVLAAGLVPPAAIDWARQDVGIVGWLLVAVIVMVGAEIVARIMSDMPVFSRINFVTRAFDLIELYGYLAYDPTLGWKMKENFYEPGFWLTTGKHSLRMNENALRDPPEGGILAVGDSFTACATHDNETWPAYLEKLTGIPVLNAGCGGYGVDQMILRAERLIPILKPKTVIVGILAQDILRCNLRLFGKAFKPWFSVKDMQLTLEGVPVPRISPATVKLNAWQKIFGHSYLVDRLMIRLGIEGWQLRDLTEHHRVHEDAQGIMVSCLLLKRLYDLTSQHGIRVIVVMLWGGHEAMADVEWSIVPPVLQIARTLGFDTVDFHEPLHAVYKQNPARFAQLWLNEDGQIGHPSKEGNAMIATHIFQRCFQTPLANAAVG
jgi:hypothetical protein